MREFRLYIQPNWRMRSTKIIKICSSCLCTCLHHMVILRTRNKITDFLMILAWASPFKASEATALGLGYNVDWDAAIPDDLVTNWIQYFKEVIQISTVSFPRSLKTDKCVNPILITLCDGSDSAFGAMAYVRWEANTEFVVRLIEAKGKLCPLN